MTELPEVRALESKVAFECFLQAPLDFGFFISDAGSILFRLTVHMFGIRTFSTPTMNDKHR